ncbi:hypothetical protein FCG40_03510 [Fimbriimonadia bacterium ATM]|nr:MAG: hypothetical protein EDM73_03195 [Armatimonadota bacterium]MBC6968497.1 hypothetical protein [Armatimonadota bacterium]MCE7898664.1 hypothetical protein [Armatimonadetes bacterium ATM1]MDL1928043.1 hypothetical protein [Fimbriimonadia bacterium ATM]RIJ98386.1 MAG: hypothetical protein DCC45_01060 [Armatimonadota bacterium]
MKHRVLGVSILLAAGFALATQSGDQFTLRRKLEAGAEDVYKFEFKSSQTIAGMMGGGDTPFDMSGSMLMTVKQLQLIEEGAKADLKVKMSDFKFDFGQFQDMAQGQMAQMPEKLEFACKLDGRNRISSVDMPTGSAQMQMMMNQMNTFSTMFIEFPEAPVKVGDSWEVTFPKNPMTGDKEVKLKAVLSGTKEHEGKTVLIVKMTGAIPINMDIGKMLESDPNMGAAMGGMRMLMTGTMEMNAEALIEKETGRTLSMDTLMQATQKMEIPDMGMAIDMVGNTAMKMLLVPKTGS